MKRILALILAAALPISFAACGSGADPGSYGPPASSSPAASSSAATAPRTRFMSSSWPMPARPRRPAWRWSGSSWTGCPTALGPRGDGSPPMTDGWRAFSRINNWKYLEFGSLAAFSRRSEGRGGLPLALPRDGRRGLRSVWRSRTQAITPGFSLGNKWKLLSGGRRVYNKAVRR